MIKNAEIFAANPRVAASLRTKAALPYSQRPCLTVEEEALLDSLNPFEALQAEVAKAKRAAALRLLNEQWASCRLSKRTPNAN